MPKIKPSLTLAALGVVGLAVWAGAQVESTGGGMATAADRLLDSLDQGQRQKIAFSFDSPERLNWHFIPRARKGLPIKELNAEQRALAFGLIGAGTSREGDLKATTIMSLEAILRDMEKGSGPARDPEAYYLSLFGDPTNKGSWGWRVEGHHLSLNFTLKDGRVVSATPAFFGANPAEVRQGPRQGLRTLAEIEDRALRLLQALDDDQAKAAVAADEAPGDIPSNSGGSAENGLPAKAPDLENVGILVSKLNPDQRQMLQSLIVAYAENMPEDVAREWLGEVQQSGQDIRFAWYGPADRNRPHAYNVRGSTFDIEFNNTQNGANHIHSVWRNVLGDFGTEGR
jgi:hypothetical protein